MSLDYESKTTAPKKHASFVSAAKIISLLTLASRILGVLRESIAARIFGAGVMASAFAVAFTVPNLFRRLFGEGALSAAFIPLYAKAIKEHDDAEARRFASGAVNLLILILVTLTLAGEALLWGLSFLQMPPDRYIALQLTAIMLPYMILICAAAFLGAILNVHRRFAAIAAAPIVLNIALIATTLWGARLFNMNTGLGQFHAMLLVSVGVLVAGAFQVAMLAPSLRTIGFRFDFHAGLWTPAIRRMVTLSIPVALGAGVLQISTLLDRGISFLLAQSYDNSGRLVSHFHLLGHTFTYPMVSGAAARLAWAQYLYQFPLGVFAIALATAIFPMLAADALEKDRTKFKEGLRKGIAVTLWEGLPASIGLIFVAGPAVQLLFERGRFLPQDTAWTALSVQVYSIAVWAYSLQQILNRAYYALHDTVTPLVMSIVTLAVNLIVEIPLVWTRLGEAGMAAGTTASFILQAVVMLWMLNRRVGGLELRQITGHVLKVLIATAVMTLACCAVKLAPIFHADLSKKTALLRLCILVAVGGITYLAACWSLGIRHPAPRR
ncbi:MAG: murein biosynthesis integral membrane protein MurJ [Tepidisphaeraceae bacterium]|jgi:putative peptidoglycan lipid II flippase